MKVFWPFIFQQQAEYKSEAIDGTYTMYGHFIEKGRAGNDLSRLLKVLI